MQKFKFIPVLDLMGGTCVYAQKGERATYEPLNTPLTNGNPDPLTVAQALIACSGADTLYIADLDAISNENDNQEKIEQIQRALPTIDLWIDPGIKTNDDAERWLKRNLGSLVIGSETITQPEIFHLLSDINKTRTILSLDFGADGFLGPQGLLEAQEDWPNRIITMSLAKVGSNEGPDLSRLKKITRLAGDLRQIFAAGGLRNIQDAHILKAADLSGALLASALHQGTITQKEIAALSEESGD